MNSLTAKLVLSFCFQVLSTTAFQGKMMTPLTIVFNLKTTESQDSWCCIACNIKRLWIKLAPSFCSTTTRTMFPWYIHCCNYKWSFTALASQDRPLPEQLSNRARLLHYNVALSNFRYDQNLVRKIKKEEWYVSMFVLVTGAHLVPRGWISVHTLHTVDNKKQWLYAFLNLSGVTSWNRC